jgi:hypothetical protein
MPLKPGVKNMRANYNKLTQKPIESPARFKAIKTLMKKHNISHDDAVHRQAIRIIQTTARKH